MRPSVGAEAELQTALLQALDRIPDIVVIRQNSGRVRVRGGFMRLAPAGTPDVQVLLPAGRVLWIELKPDKPHHNPKTIAAQKAWRERADRMGHVVLELRDVQRCVGTVMHYRYEALKTMGRVA
jgi:hypothetical protein